MTPRIIGLCLLASCTAFCLLATPVAAEEDAKTLSDKGAALLASGDFDGAIDAYKGAAKADKDNPEYRMQYSLLRRVIKVREQLDTEKDAERWEHLALALHRFYHTYDVYTESLKLDRQIHKRKDNAESAVMLAETQLALAMNAEAETLLSGLDKKKANSRTNVLLGVATARQDKMEIAKGIAAKCKVTKEMGPGELFDLACLKSLIADTDGSLEALTACFEQTPPSLLVDFKTYARESDDLKSIAKAPGFAKALKTKSVVEESKCSGGSGCGKCPSRSSCDKDKAKAAGEDKGKDKPKSKDGGKKKADEHKHDDGCSHGH